MAKVNTKPTVRFSRRAWQKMWALTDACPIEISAMGIVETRDRHKSLNIKEDFYITDFFVVDQECSAASTDMDESALIDLMMELRSQGVESTQVCVWWHSHVNMTTGHSQTDEDQIERFDFDNVCISIITNKKREINLRIDTYSPVRHTFEKCSYVIEEVPIIPEGWGKEMVEEHVKKSVPSVLNIVKSPKTTNKTSWTNHSYNYGGYGGSHWRTPGIDNSGWDHDDDGTAVVVDSEEEIENHPTNEWLDFPHKLLQECYEEDIITPNEALRYYGQLCKKDISDEELDEELKTFFNFVDEDEKDETALTEELIKKMEIGIK